MIYIGSGGAGLCGIGYDWCTELVYSHFSPSTVLAPIFARPSSVLDLVDDCSGPERFSGVRSVFSEIYAFDKTQWYKWSCSRREVGM